MSIQQNKWGQLEGKEITEKLNRNPEYLIEHGSNEEKIWAAGVLSKGARLKDTSLYVRNFYEASSVIRKTKQNGEKEIDYYFEAGKEGKPFPRRAFEIKEN